MVAVLRSRCLVDCVWLPWLFPWWSLCRVYVCLFGGGLCRVYRCLLGCLCDSRSREHGGLCGSLLQLGWMVVCMLGVHHAEQHRTIDKGLAWC